MILRFEGPNRNDLHVSGGEGVPEVGAFIDNGGQFYHTVTKVTWKLVGFFRHRLEPVVYVHEHDRFEERFGPT